MFTRKRWTPPNIPPSLAPDVQQYLRDLNKSVSDYLLSLEAKGSLTINEAEITASQGIKFPATQVASSDANTLDDYEEGAWTPTANNISFSAVGGSYTKIGSVVFARFNVLWPTTADANQAQIKNLPFAMGGSSGDYGSGSISGNDFGSALAVVSGGSGTTYMIVADGATYAAKTNANMSGKQLIGQFIYTVN